ncbi:MULTISPECIES: heavy metal-associated domain-containing protein [Hydrotalea]|uniref:heavy-metal-associated domain-containing protein n=1 Tax=Hydrotalea TaxID=1004300 RepID=UPI0009440E23|nr:MULTISPECIES: heavy metal-associated domain-containing protein [Hydrotalea]RWZ87394.1 MAG: heavy-metal-associated domain-containing protein [Hydrotalea sp. AMD]
MLTSADIQVQNIKCGGCVAAIEKNIGSMPGVQHVSVNQATGMVTITGIGLQTDEIKQQLTKLGYPPAPKNSVFKRIKTSIQCVFKQ